MNLGTCMSQKQACVKSCKDGEPVFYARAASSHPSIKQYVLNKYSNRDGLSLRASSPFVIMLISHSYEASIGDGWTKKSATFADCAKFHLRRRMEETTAKHRGVPYCDSMVKHTPFFFKLFFVHRTKNQQNLSAKKRSTH